MVEDVLLARQRIRPLILVMPFGSTSTFTDKEWANGIGRDQAWETFVASDLVHAVDARFRTIPRGADRVVAGLSEGGYGALNIGLHHPGEFRVLESWSGYEQAADLKSIFGGRRTLLAANSPLATLPHAARALRAAGTYVWAYSGTTDSFHVQNTAFARRAHPRRCRPSLPARPRWAQLGDLARPGGRRPARGIASTWRRARA